MRRICVAVVCGAVGAYVGLATAPTGSLLILLAFVLGLRVFHVSLREAGALVASAGGAGALLTGRDLWLAARCDYQPCTSPLTEPTFVACLALVVVGIGLIIFSARTAGSRG